MRKRRFLVITGILASLLIAGTLWEGLDWWYSRPVNLNSVTLEQWHEDLNYMAKTLAARHKNVFHHISETQYDALVNQIAAALPGLQAADIPVYFEKLTAAIGDAHTYLALPGGQHFYPFTIYYFGDTPRVISAAPQCSRILGMRLVSIGSVPMPQVEARLNEVLTQGENPWYYRAHYPWFLSQEVLHALGIVSGPATSFTFSDGNHTVVLNLDASANQTGKWLHAYPQPPLFIQHENDDFWFGPLGDSKSIYVAFNDYHDLSEHAHALFEFLDSHSVDKLIIDMRDNSGGDYLEGRKYLIAPLLERPNLNRKGVLYVITGRYTFSAAMNNAVQFRLETQATLVGEPPGEMPNSYQERRSFHLPNSHLQVNYSARYYRFLADDNPALLPDIDAAPNWDDYQQGIDPALQAITRGHGN